MKWLLQPKATKLIENVWAGFDSIFGAFFISYFDSKKRILPLSRTLSIHLFCLCMHLFLDIVVYYILH